MRYGTRTVFRTLGRAACTCVALLVCVAPAAAQARSGVDGPAGDTLATVHGTVVAHGSGVPLAEATVSLAAGPGAPRGIGTRVTDQHGEFLFRDVPPGTYTLKVDLVGYLGRSDTVRVAPGGDVRITAELSVSAVPLEPLVVSVTRPPSRFLEGFERRRKTTGGFFLTRDQIEASHTPYVSDLLRRVPGATVVPRGSYGYDVRLRGGCRPDLWIDGVRTGSEVSIDLLVPPTDVEAIEVYRGPELPGRFGTNPCGAIVVWTRRPARSDDGGSLLKHLTIVVGVMLIGYLVGR